MHSLTDKEFGTMSEICSMVVPNEPPNLTIQSIHTKGAVPSPRSNFSLCKFTPTQVFLHGGTDEEDDLNDAYILDLTTMSWTKLELTIKLPLVGHSSVTLHRSLNQNKAYLYIFGGWDSTTYSNKGILIDPHDNYKVQITTYDESYLDSNYEPMSGHMSSTQNPKTLLKSVSLMPSPPRKSKGLQLPPSTPQGGDKSVIFREAVTTSQHSSLHSIHLKRITWFGTTGSDKTKSETTFKIGFDGRAPVARKDHTLTADPKGQRIFLYGGDSGGFSWNNVIRMESLKLEDWQWTKILPKGDIPPVRRGHTSVCLGNQETLIIYGGCSGPNRILDDCYQYNMQTNYFTKVKPLEGKYHPDGRAWHCATLIGEWIYYYGGLKDGFKATNEVLAFEFLTHQWFKLSYTVDQSIQDIERFGHKAINVDTNILVFGGSTYIKPVVNISAYTRPKEKKVSLEEILILETYGDTPLDLDRLKERVPKEQPKGPVYAIDQWGMSEVKPPAIPAEFQDPKRLLEEQGNFWHWNPHIFPEDANKRKIQYFKHKADEEARKSKTSNVYYDIEGIDDDETSSPTIHK